MHQRFRGDDLLVVARVARYFERWTSAKTSSFHFNNFNSFIGNRFAEIIHLKSRKRRKFCSPMNRMVNFDDNYTVKEKLFVNEQNGDRFEPNWMFMTTLFKILSGLFCKLSTFTENNKEQCFTIIR